MKTSEEYKKLSAFCVQHSLSYSYHIGSPESYFEFFLNGVKYRTTTETKIIEGLSSRFLNFGNARFYRDDKEVIYWALDANERMFIANRVAPPPHVGKTDLDITL